MTSTTRYNVTSNKVNRRTEFEQLLMRFIELDSALDKQYEPDWNGRLDRSATRAPVIGLVASRRDTSGYRDTGGYTGVQCEPLPAHAQGEP